MLIARKLLLLCTISFFLIGHNVSKALAGNVPLSDALQKCDGLMGKSPKAVFDILGQPDEAGPAGDRTQPEHILGWEYKDKTGNSLELLFSPTKGLMVVIYNGLTVGSSTPDPNNLIALLASYNMASLKVGYETNVGPNLYYVLINAKTPHGNVFRIKAEVNSTDPQIRKHIFNSTKGIFVDSFSPNPSPVISSFLAVTPAILVSPRILSARNPDKLPARWQAISFQAAKGNSFWPDRMNYMPLTRKIAPCLQTK